MVATRVLVVDDNDRVRRAIVEMLKDGCEVCGEAANGVEAVDRVRALGPDIVLLDLNMPIMDGYQAAETILSFAPATKIVFISLDDSPSSAYAVKAAGAQGFISKSCGSRAFKEAISAFVK